MSSDFPSIRIEQLKSPYIPWAILLGIGVGYLLGTSNSGEPSGFRQTPALNGISNREPVSDRAVMRRSAQPVDADAPPQAPAGPRSSSGSLRRPDCAAAGSPAVRGDLTYHLASWAFGSVAVNYRDKGYALSEAPYVWIELVVLNTSKDRLASSFVGDCELRDDLGNEYREPSVGGFFDSILERYVGSDLYPGKMSKGLFVFQLPVGAANRLIFSVPANPSEGRTDRLDFCLERVSIPRLDRVVPNPPK